MFKDPIFMNMLITVVDTAAITVGVIGVICALAYFVQALQDWIRAEFIEEDILETVDEE